MSLKSIEHLRDWSSNLFFGEPNLTNDKIQGFADTIEMEHELAIGDAYGRGAMSTLDNDELLESQGWIRLPVDVNGEFIHVGDKLRLSQGKVTEVRFMTINEAGWLVNEAGWLPLMVRHVQQDSWEKIIEDAFDAALQGSDELWDSSTDRDTLVARCKALAKEDE